ncbi:MAG: DMT family transporter [Bdellovibrionaceae bacterium]|nr:DMT family transporter [Pseudobdellovibrionaceae bacterium]
MVAALLSIMAGIFAVTQAGMNKLIGDSWGFSSSLLLNGVVYFACNALLFAAAYSYPKWFSSEYTIQGSLGQFRLWWIAPGICGFLLVLGLAYSVLKIGAAHTFIITVTAQIVFGVVWDLAIEHRPIAMTRFAGAGLALVGALLASR